MKIKKFLILIFALVAFGMTVSRVHAAITFDASSSKAIGAGATNWFATGTVGSGSNEIFVITIASGGNTTSSNSVTVDGVSATKVINNSGATNKNVEIWYALNLSAGTHNVTATFGAAVNGVIGLTSFFGANQSATVDATSSATATTNTPSSSLTTTVSGDLVIDTITHGVPTTTGNGASQTVLYKDKGSASNQGNASYIIATTTGSYISSWTLSNSTNTRMVQVAFKAAGAPDATSVSTTTGNDGARTGDTITITGANFTSVSAGNRATCNGGAGTGCIQFVVGGTATVADANISAWSDTSITFTVSSTLATTGGSSSLEVWVANASDTTPLTYYLYPKITTLYSFGSSAARTYNASDTDGLIMLLGDRFGAATSSATVISPSAAIHYVAEGSCSVAGYSSTTLCLEVPTSIATTTYSGNVTFTRAGDGKTATTSISILPRILSVSPVSTSTGNVVQLLGDHLCAAGGCPVSPNRATSTNHVTFGNTTSSDSDFVAQTGGAGACNGSGAAWVDTEICVKVPASIATGSASTTVTANLNLSNLKSFTVSNPSPPSTAPGTPTYSSINSSTVTASWTAAAGSSIYKLERATSSQVYAQIAATSSLSYPDSGLSANTTYYYRVRGSNAGGDGPYSASSSVLTLPDVPGTPTYTNIVSSSLTVNWTAPAGGAASYVVQRATSSQVYAQVGTTTSLSFNDSGLMPSTNYFYWVQAVNATGGGAFSASSSVTTTGSNSPPNAPSQDAPASGSQGIILAPVFKMTATDPNSDNLQYKVTVYSNVGCTTVVQTNDQSSSQVGWSGQNASSSHEYTSGSQASFTAQSSLTAATTYYWKASAKDPEGSNTWTDSATCNSFTTTNGNWAVDSGSWTISANALTVAPSSGSSVQLHVQGVSQTNVAFDFQLKVSNSGAGSGNAGAIARADTGANRYLLPVGDFENAANTIWETNSGVTSRLASTSVALNGNTYYNFRGYINGSTLKGWKNGGSLATATDNTIAGSGFIGLAASSTNGSVTFTVDNFAAYTQPIITFNNLPGAGSWAVLDHNGNNVSFCQTASSWDFSFSSQRFPIDYNSGGGQVALWLANNSCTGIPDLAYPSGSLANDILGGDVYAYNTAASGTPGLAGGTVMMTSTITISPTGAISYQ